MITFDGPGEWVARADFGDFGRRLDFGVLRRSERSPFPDMVLDSLSFVAVDPTAATLRAAQMPAGEGRAMLQAIVDAAWESGVRPRQLALERRESAAQRYHLEDLRALVFGAKP